MEFSSETRRLIELSRGTDDPPPAAERAVRDRLIAQLGAAALTGAAASVAAASVTETAGAMGAGALSGGAPSMAVAGAAAANVAAAVGTTTLTKTVAGLVVIAGVGTGAMQTGVVAERVRELPAQVGVQAEHVATQIWELVTGRDDAVAPTKSLEPSLGFDARRHQLLMNIARRPERPVAKEAELVLILGAEDALSASDTSRATSFLDRHEERFAEGVLSDNREAIRVLVHCAHGAEERTKNGAREFVRRFPASDQIARLRACAFAAPIVETASPSPSTVAPPPGSDKPNF